MNPLPIAALRALRSRDEGTIAAYVAHAHSDELAAVKAAMMETWMYDTGSPDWTLLRLTISELGRRGREEADRINAALARRRRAA